MMHRWVAAVSLLFVLVAWGDATTVPAALDAGKAMQITVRQEKGEPVAGVMVRLRVDGIERAAGETSAQGQWSVTPPGTRGVLEIVAYKAGYSPVAISWAGVRAANPPARVDLTLSVGGTIGGSVRIPAATPVKAVPGEPAGDGYVPVANAKVFVSADGPVPRRGEPTLNFKDLPVVTDKEGRWSLSLAFVPWTSITIRAEHADAAIEPYPGAPPEDRLRSETWITYLKPSVAIPGTVKDAAGKPVAGATVALLGSYMGVAGELVKTDEQGAFSVPRAGPGPWTVGVRAAGVGWQQQTVRVGKVPPVALEFQLAAGRTGRGRVVDAARQPVAGAVVTARSWAGALVSGFWQGTTDAEGRYAVDLPAEALAMEIRVPGCGPAYAAFPAGADQEVVTAVYPIAVVRGTVVDAQTLKPLPRFTVMPGTVVGDGRKRWLRQWASAEEGGQFECSMEAVGEGGYVQVEADGYLPAVAGPVTRANPGPVEVRLDPGEAIRGTILDNEGKPVEAAEVLLAGRDGVVSMSNGKVAPASRWACPGTFTDAQGQFVLGGQADPFTLVVVHENGYAAVKPGRFFSGGTVTLPPWATITGEVGGAKPLASVGLTLRMDVPEDEEEVVTHYLSASSDAKGQYAFAHVPPGKGFLEQGLRARAALGPQTATVARVSIAAGQNIVLNIGGGRAVAGRVKVPADLRDNCAFVAGTAATQVELPAAPYPTDWPRRTVEQRRAWWREFLGSDAGKAFAAQREQALAGQRSYGFAVTKAGAFRIDDMAPGTYLVRVPVMETTAAGTVAKVWGVAETTITVEAGDTVLRLDPLEVKNP